MHIVDKVATVLDEAPAPLREPLLTFLRQHQAGETPDIACLFVAIVELQDQLNGVVHDNGQLSDALADAERENRKLASRIDDLTGMVFRS